MTKRKNNKLDTNLKLIAKSSMQIFIIFIFSKFFIYFYRISIARHYGPEVYGLFALSLIILGWLRIFSELGLPTGLLRYIPLYRGKKKEEYLQYSFQKTFLIIILTSLSLGIILFILSNFISLYIFKNSDLSSFLKIFSFAVPLVPLSGFLMASIRAFERPALSSFLEQILNSFFKLLLILIFILFGFGAFSVPLSYVLGIGMVFLITLITCKYYLSFSFFKKIKLKKKVKKRVFSSLFSYSWPLLFFGLTMSILHWTDSLFIGLFKTVKDVGFYNAAVPIAVLLTVPCSLFATLFFPLVTREYSKGNKELVKELSKQVGKWIFILSLPILIFFILFPGVFINILFGKEYIIAKNALRFLSIGALFITLFDISRQLISMEGKSKIILIDVILMATINIILNLILIPLYGINGAAFSTMVSLIILNLIFAFQSWKYLSIIPVKRKMFRIFLVGVVSAILLFIIASLVSMNILSLLLLGIFFMAFYIILLLITNCLDENDLLIIEAFEGKFFQKIKFINLKK